MPSDDKRKSYGETQEYLLRRMARDAPEVLEAYGRGEYPSVAASVIYSQQLSVEPNR